MSITKKFLKSKPVCKVTFAIEHPEAKKAYLIGDFNDWNEESTPLKKLKNGKFKTTLDLDANKQYEFRYKVDNQWTNDPEADAEKHCSFTDAKNCVLDLSN